MKRSILFFRLFTSAALFIAAMVLLTGAAMADNAATDSAREKASFDRDWKFHFGDAAGAEKESFDDSSWSAVDLPHDWMITGVSQGAASAMDGPFDKNSPARDGGAYLNGGVGWYRKAFTVPESDKGRKVSILFDGAYMDSDVYLNGQKLGNRPYGFSSSATT